jgi:putative lipoprotein
MGSACSADPADRELSTSRAGMTFVYRCVDGYRFVARFEPERVWLFLESRPTSLPQVPAASGIQYTDSKTTFRVRGAEAWIEIGGSTHVACTNQPAEVPWETARLAGVDFRAVGREPGWTLEMNDGSGIVFVTDEGRTMRQFPPGSTEARDGTIIHTSAAHGRTIRVEREDRECHDPMSGERFSVTARVTVDGGEYRGCGRRLE